MIRRLPNPEPGEKIILLLRRDRFIILIQILFWTIVGLGPLLLWYILRGLGIELTATPVGDALVKIFLSVYYLYTWLFAFHSFVDYYLDVWVVTNRRIINIEQKSLFMRQSSEQKLYRIQDVTAELRGFFSTIFNYGTVYIQTAGEEQRFIFKQVPDPNGVARKINKLAEERKRYERMLEHDDEPVIHAGAQ